MLSDEALRRLLAAIFQAPALIKCLVFSAVSAGFYYLGVYRKHAYPAKIYSNEASFFLGVLSTAAAIGYLGVAMDSASGHFSLLILIAAVAYGFLGIWFQSTLVWVFSLLSLGSWIGAETGYISGWGAYYRGMNTQCGSFCWVPCYSGEGP